MQLFGTFVCWSVLLISEMYRIGVDAQDSKANAKWSYIDTEDNGPKNWGKLGYKECDGDMQSPIYLDIPRDYKGPTKYQALDASFLQHGGKIEGLKLENTGNAVVLSLPDVDEWKGNKRPYVYRAGIYVNCYFKEIRFHFGYTAFAGSEHNITFLNGFGSSMEIQSLYECPSEQQKGNTGLVVLAQKVNALPCNEENTQYQPIIKSLEKIRYAGTNTTIEEGIALIDLYIDYKERKKFITYEGSLTYPPCTEGVIWVVFENIMNMSLSQLEAFQGLYRTSESDRNPQYLFGNIRPVQKTNNRNITVVRTHSNN